MQLIRTNALSQLPAFHKINKFIERGGL